MTNNYNPPPSLEDEGGAMRGDAVGSTMYSERWILKILMQLTKLSVEEWNSDFESEVCVLWDMSAEEDVVHLLMQHNMLGLAIQIIINSDNCRLTEIMVGIIGNMCCVESVRTELGKRVDVVEILLELLSTSDVPTLLQVLRVFETCAWDVKSRMETHNKKTNSAEVKIKDNVELETTESMCGEGVLCEKEALDNIHIMTDTNIGTELCRDKPPELVYSDVPSFSCQSEQLTDEKETSLCDVKNPWLQHFLNIDSWRLKILFILSSSKHDELLSNAWSFLSTLCYLPIGKTVFSQQIVDTDLMTGLVESYKEVFEESFKTYETNDIEPVKKAACHWVSVLYSFTLHREGVEVLCQFRADVLSCLFNLLHYCHSVLVLDEELATFITSSVAILDVMFSAGPYEWSHFTSGLLSTIKLWEKLSESKSVQFKDNQSTILEDEAMKALEEFFTSVYKWLEEKKTDDTFEKYNFIYKQLSQLLNSRIT